MSKTILITGSTDGIGLELAKSLGTEGHKVLLHGRSAGKLDAAKSAVPGHAGAYLADLSKMEDVAHLAEAVTADHPQLDVLINNAGILKTPTTQTENGHDIRFEVNTVAPYLLALKLLPIIPKDGRIVNLSSAAQAPVDLSALKDGGGMDDMTAYSQSKLAITVWSQELARRLPEGPLVVSVNPGSLLASKMVKEGFGIAGNDIGIGVDILRRAALSAEFDGASGRYFDNDAERFGDPHPDAADRTKSEALMATLDNILKGRGLI